MGIEAEFADQVTFIGVPGLSDDRDAKASFLDDTGANTFYTLVSADAVWEAFDITSHGAFVFVNDDGTWTATQRTGSLREGVEGLIAS